MPKTAQRRQVTLDEIAEQRSLGWPDFHPEDYCHRCGHRNAGSWSVDSVLWNKAVGDPTPILCPSCFVAAAEAAGIDVHWCLVPEEGDAQVGRFRAALAQIIDTAFVAMNGERDG